MRKLAAVFGCISLLAAGLLVPTATKTSAGGAPPTPGVYVYYDWKNLSPSSYPWIKGSEISTLWNVVEPSEGAYNFSNLDNWLNNSYNQGKASVIKVTANDRQYNGVPDYVWNAGTPKIWVGSYYYPKWWDNTFVSKYTNMIARLGQKYNNDSRVSAIAISIGEYGEAMPGYGSVSNYAQYWYNAGLTSDIWVSYSKRVIDAYVAAFPNKPLFLQEQSFNGDTSGMWNMTDYAASKGVGMGFNGLADDNSKDAHWYTPFSKWVEPGTVMGRLEQGPPNMDQKNLYWSVLNALRNHATIISFYINQNTDWGNKDSFDFANKYAGKSLRNTPGVWSALKEVNPNNYMGPKGNYEFWMYQLNPATTSVPVYNLGTDKRGAFARRTDQATGKNYLTFNIDDRYIYGGASSVRITVTYYDSGWDSFELQYDAADNAYKRAGSVSKTNTYTWKQAVFSLSDAAFVNREGGGDLRLYNRGDGDDTFHLVEVERLGGTAPTLPTATATTPPASTNTPARTSTPSATTVPATLTPTGTSTNPSTATAVPATSTPTRTAIPPSPTFVPDDGASISARVEGPDDDAYQLSNGANQFSDKVYFGTGYVAGFRFGNMAIPKGARINSATLSVSPPWYYDSTAQVTIFGEDSDNAASLATGLVASRPRTASSETWNIVEPWTYGRYYDSPDLSAVIQEVVSRKGWNSGNSMALILNAPTSAYRSVLSYEGSSSMAATLSISYAVDTPSLPRGWDRHKLYLPLALKP